MDTTYGVANTPMRRCCGPLRLATLLWMVAPTAHAGDASATYATLCAACHGSNGDGQGVAAAALPVKPANFTAPTFHAERTDDVLRTAITDGGAAVGRSPLMPGFGTQLAGEDLTAMVAYLRGMATPTPKGNAAPTGPSTPDSNKKMKRRRQRSSQTPPTNRFLLRGFTAASFAYTDEAGPTFDKAVLAPVFLWRLHERVLVEAELEFTYADDEFDVGLEYAQIDLMPWDELTVAIGLFLQPLGVYSERIHPTWINRMPDAPYPYQGGHHGGPLPGAGLGLQLRGAAAIGPQSAVNYVAFVSNGPSQVGVTFSPSIQVPDNNWNKFVGGRFGYLPIRQIEFGVSATGGQWDDDVNRSFVAMVADTMIHLDGLNVVGEYIATRTEQLDADVQWRQLWWAETAYRFTHAPGQAANFELVARYGGAALPETSADHTETPSEDGTQLMQLSPSHDEEPVVDDLAEATKDLAGLDPGTSHQLALGLSYYPIQNVAIRFGGHITLPNQHTYIGVQVTAGL